MPDEYPVPVPTQEQIDEAIATINAQLAERKAKLGEAQTTFDPTPPPSE